MNLETMVREALGTCNLVKLEIKDLAIETDRKGVNINDMVEIIFRSDGSGYDVCQLTCRYDDNTGATGIVEQITGHYRKYEVAAAVVEALCQIFRLYIRENLSCALLAEELGKE